MKQKAPLFLFIFLTLVLGGLSGYLFKQNKDLKAELSTSEETIVLIKKQAGGINVDDLPSEMFTGDQYNAVKDKADFFEERCIQFVLLIPALEKLQNDPSFNKVALERLKVIEGYIKKYGLWTKDGKYEVPALPYRKDIH